MRQEIHDKLDELLTLEEGWDSYGGHCISLSAVRAARGLLNVLMSDDTPTPSICPVCTGDVGIEWHVSGVNLEIQTAEGGKFYCLDCTDSDSDNWTEWYADGADDRLRKLVAKITEANRAN